MQLVNEYEMETGGWARAISDREKKRGWERSRGAGEEGRGKKLLWGGEMRQRQRERRGREEGRR